MPVWLFVPLLFFIRMFGLFSLIPLMKPLLESLAIPVTPVTLALLSSSYSLSQAIFQWPLSALSDKYGRLFIIRFGLLLFALGSIIAYFSNSLSGIIISRIIQGAGAIGATAQAFLADHAQGEKFQLNFYLIGIAIAISFGLSFLIAPLFSSYFIPKQLFLIITILIFGGLIASYYVKNIKKSETIDKQAFIFSKPICLILASSFIIHFLQTYLFTSYPLLTLNNPTATYRNLFCYAFLFSLYPLAKRNFKLILSYCIFCIFIFFIASLYLNYIYQNSKYLYDYYILMILLILLLLEATLPSLLTIHMNGKKGAIIGLYSTSQYLAMSLGGIMVASTSSPQKIFFMQLLCYFLLLLTLQGLNESRPSSS